MTLAKHVPVLIVGAGPVGVTMANLLGHYGVPALVVDRSPQVLDFPRAVGLDDEALRTFQAAGLAEDMLRDMIQNVPMRMYTADKRCFAEIQPATREFGWCRRNLFSQPLGEQTLRKGLQRYPHVQLELGQEVIALTQDADGVDVTLRDADGHEHTTRASYVVGSDGGCGKNGDRCRCNRTGDKRQFLVVRHLPASFPSGVKRRDATKPVDDVKERVPASGGAVAQTAPPETGGCQPAAHAENGSI